MELSDCRRQDLCCGEVCAICRAMRSKRDDLAIVACILSAAALGYGYLYHDLDAVDVFDWLWLIWFVIAQWLSGRWWRKLNLSVGGLYQEATRGRLKLTGTALMIERAAFVFFAAMVVSWLIAHHWL